MSRIFILALALGFICQPAFALRKKSVEEKPAALARVQPLTKQARVDSGCFIYALPRTVFRVQVVVERDVFVAGPYAAYAEKYLGISKSQQANKTRYAIRSAQVEAFQEADAGSLYLVQPLQSGVRFDFLRATREGLMLAADNFSVAAESAAHGFKGSSAMPMFTNVGVESMFHEEDEEEDTTGIAQDTAGLAGEVELPEVQPVPVAPSLKTTEERASEAAQLLLNLRKRKFELLTGDIDAVFNSNDALKVAIAELKQMEHDYLALFVGKHIKTRVSYVYDVAPMAGTNSYTVFKFSDEAGVQGVEGQGRAIKLELQPENKYADANVAADSRDSSSFRLRLPDVAQLRLLDGKDEMYRGRYQVYQNGKIIGVRFEHFLKTE